MSNERVGWRQRAANLHGEFVFAVDCQICLATAEARDMQLRNSQVGYLLRVERYLQPASLVQRISRSLARGAGTGV